MSFGYLLLLGAVASFAAMGIFHKLADRYNSNPLHITVFCMLAALLLNTCRVTLTAPADATGLHAVSFPAQLFWIAIPFGLCASAAFWFFQTGLRYGRIATSWLFINLSAAVPTVLSLIVYPEEFQKLSKLQIAAFGLILGALVLLWYDRMKDQGKKPNLGGDESPETLPGFPVVENKPRPAIPVAKLED